MEREGYHSQPSVLPHMNFVRLITVLFIAFGYASTMPLGPEYRELLAHFGFDPSWIGIQVLFFISGYLALRSLRRHGSPLEYLKSRIIRNLPLLAVFTLIAVGVIYPLLGVRSESFGALFRKLALYYIETVSCINPGQALPGLLDDAKYMCLIQGAIWTFKWGAIAHIGTAIGYRLGLFSRRSVIAGLTVLATIVFWIASDFRARGYFPELEPLWTGLHLAMPFLWGMTALEYQGWLDRLGAKFWIIAAALIGLGALWYHAFFWSPAIEILVTGFWCMIAWRLMSRTANSSSLTARTPDLTLAIYLIMWPAAQLWLLALPNISSLQLGILGVVTSLVTGWVAFQLINRHAFQKAREISGRKVALQTA